MSPKFITKISRISIFFLQIRTLGFASLQAA